MKLAEWSFETPHTPLNYIIMFIFMINVYSDIFFIQEISKIIFLLFTWQQFMFTNTESQERNSNVGHFLDYFLGVHFLLCYEISCIFLSFLKNMDIRFIYIYFELGEYIFYSEKREMFYTPQYNICIK